MPYEYVKEKQNQQRSSAGQPVVFSFIIVSLHKAHGESGDAIEPVMAIHCNRGK